jgi:hypothetical protein
MENGWRKDYNLTVQHEHCGESSATKSSVSSITSTPKELVDVATDMTIRTSVALFQNTSQEYTTPPLPEDSYERTNESDTAFTLSTSKDRPRPNDNKGTDNSEGDASGTQTTPYSKRSVGTQVTSEAEPRTTPKSKTGDWAWIVNTLVVALILPITLGVAVFVSLIAVNYVTMRCRFNRPQHNIQREASHVSACSHVAVPLLNTQLMTDFTMQSPGCGDRRSVGVRQSEYHEYEEIC